jgi:hypothetical protein
VAPYAMAASFLHIHILLPTHVHVNTDLSKDGTDRGRIEGEGDRTITAERGDDRVMGRRQHQRC